MNAHAQQVQHRFGAEAQNWSGLYGQRASRSIYVHNLQQRRQHALQLLETAEGRIFEIGCGAGNVILSIPHENGLKLFGTDFSPEMLRQTRQNANGQKKEISLLAADALSLPFQNASFNAVLCLGLLEYVLDYEKVLSECHRILKSGGKLIVSVPNMISPFVRIDDFGFGLKNRVTQSLPVGIRRWIKTQVFGRKDRPYFNHRRLRFNPSCFTKLLESIGFLVKETTYHTFGFGLLNGLKLNVDLSTYLEARVKHRKKLEKFGWTCILKAIKS